MSSGSVDVAGGIEEALNRVLTLPLPQAIDPLITVAQELDTIALSVANGLLTRKVEEILLEDLEAGSDRRRVIIARRRMQAVRSLQAKFRRLKRDKELKERKAQEDGWDPFYAVFQAVGSLNIPGTNRFELVNDGQEANEGFSAIVRPIFGGDVDQMIKVTDGSFTVNLTPSSSPDTLLVELSQLDIGLEPVELADGLSSGPNRIRKYSENTGGVGDLDIATGRFSFRFEGSITNSIYNEDSPILFFAHAQGVLSRDTAEVSISADDPMVVPLPPGQAVREMPSWTASVSATFDAAARMLRLTDGIQTTRSPRISLVRYRDGSYSYRRNQDAAIGAEIQMQGLTLRSQEGPRRFSFNETPLTIRTASDVLLDGRLVEVVLDGDTGEFFGELRIGNLAAGRSRLMAEFASLGRPILVQLATGVGAFDLLELTQSFSATAETPSIDLAHGTSGLLEGEDRKIPRIPILGVLFALIVAISVRLLVRRRGPSP